MNNIAPPSSPPGGWPDPTAAYIHVPFCRHRCGYCNFSVVTGRDDLVDRFLAAIDTELASLHRPAVDTVFIGGGTPTHLSVAQLRRLVDCVQRRFELSSDVEWSIEANPEDINDQKLTALTAGGVNRISLGVQSFQSAKLQLLERGHSGQAAQAVIERVAQQLENVSIDLIFAAPEESMEDWQRDLQSALSLPIRHLSTYALTFEKGTSYWSRMRRGLLSPATELVEVAMYELTREMIAESEFEQYEISSFAHADSMCRHNLAYWHGRGWFAAGPGAARFTNGRREVNHRSPTTYLKKILAGESPVAESETINAEQFARERAAFGIRMIDGIDLDTLRVETGVDLQLQCHDAIQQSIQQGLLHREGNRVKLTSRGVLFADTVASDLLG